VLLHFGRRFYDPVSRQFLSVDPLRLDGVGDALQGPNTLQPYIFAAGNPVKYGDKVGAAPEEAIELMESANLAANAGSAFGVGSAVGWFVGGVGSAWQPALTWASNQLYMGRGRGGAGISDSGAELLADAALRGSGLRNYAAMIGRQIALGLRVAGSATKGAQMFLANENAGLATRIMSGVGGVVGENLPGSAVATVFNATMSKISGPLPSTIGVMSDFLPHVGAAYHVTEGVLSENKRALGAMHQEMVRGSGYNPFNGGISGLARFWEVVFGVWY